MSGSREKTFADIAAMLRHEAHMADNGGCFANLGDALRAFADMIEETGLRVTAVPNVPRCDWSLQDALNLANSLANFGVTDQMGDIVSSCIYSLCHEIVDGPGDAAKMRRALESVMRCIDINRTCSVKMDGSHLITNYRKTVRDALAAPARNCDTTKDAAEEAYKREFGRPWNTVEDELAAWLFAERKGGAA